MGLVGVAVLTTMNKINALARSLGGQFAGVRQECGKAGAETGVAHR
jgi:hypothetical protein